MYICLVDYVQSPHAAQSPVSPTTFNSRRSSARGRDRDREKRGGGGELGVGIGCNKINRGVAREKSRGGGLISRMRKSGIPPPRWATDCDGEYSSSAVQSPCYEFVPIFKWDAWQVLPPVRDRSSLARKWGWKIVEMKSLLAWQNSVYIMPFCTLLLIHPTVPAARCRKSRHLSQRTKYICHPEVH
ncbi:hypothetical protein KQX54_005042 [Cotesia glomerata]|uniref:Uncharacterized protein n=1 Tax=Cotesia glomerata TaxID=32391 RepID=A0AAV7IBJ2_COTGL|nr:hypothetical protein KQX54_005042 [Cotesia glomerata]